MEKDTSSVYETECVCVDEQTWWKGGGYNANVEQIIFVWSFFKE